MGGGGGGVERVKGGRERSTYQCFIFYNIHKISTKKRKSKYHKCNKKIQYKNYMYFELWRVKNKPMCLLKLIIQKHLLILFCPMMISYKLKIHEISTNITLIFY